eukprot:6721099-Pyramimonas_sp.AAC.1
MPALPASDWYVVGICLQDMEAHEGGWAGRIYVGVGTREYSATRDHNNDHLDRKLLQYSDEAVDILKASVVNKSPTRGIRLRNTRT